MTTRRDFLKNVALGSTAVIGTSLLGQATFAQPAAASGKFKKTDMVQEKGGTAESLKYCANADKEHKSKKVMRCENCTDSKKRCRTCNFFTLAGKEGSQDAGKCLLIQDPPNKYVYATGCCNSWAAKV